MGDRANIRVVFEKGQSIYFYTHWSGSALAAQVREVLRRRECWDDDAYLARMLFCGMLVVTNRDGSRNDPGTTNNVVGTMGLGISPTIVDNEYLIIRVELEHQRVIFDEETDDPVQDAARREDKTAGWSFEEFTQLDDEALAKAWNGGDE